MPYRDEFDDPFEDTGKSMNDQNIAGALGALRRQIFLKTRGPALAGGVLALALLILAGVVFFTYPSEQEEDLLPVIQADARPYKVSPDEPGGMDIPHRDSTLFSSLRSSRGESATAEVENLFAEEDGAEEPLPRSQLFAGLNTEDEDTALDDIEPAASTEELLNEGIDEADSLFGDPETAAAQEKIAELKAEDQRIIDEISSAPAKVELKAEEQTVDIFVPQEEAEKAEVSEPAPVDVPESETEVQEEKVAVYQPKEPAVTKKAEVVPPGDYYAQIGAVKSAAAAESGWGQYQKQFGAALSGLDHRVQRADLGEKGIYYRIQAGPFSKEKAESVCTSIKAQSGGCLVVGK